MTFIFFLELSPVLQQLYLLSSEMIHLIHQLQYYFLFEVMECSWDKLISNVQQADGLDDIIKAHSQFLARIKAGALVDDSSEVCITLIHQFIDLTEMGWLTKFHVACGSICSISSTLAWSVVRCL